MARQVSEVATLPTPANPPAGNGNGGGITNHRLTELERRMGVLEQQTLDIAKGIERIETKLGETASKSLLWQVFAGTGVLAVLTFVGYLLMRSGAAGG